MMEWSILEKYRNELRIPFRKIRVIHSHFEKSLEYIKNKDKVLDVGCGNKRFGDFLGSNGFEGLTRDGMWTKVWV